MKSLLNQRELSDLSGVSQWTISRIEHGRRLPHVVVAQQLAEVLGVTIEDIFFFRGIGIGPVIGQRRVANDL